MRKGVKHLLLTSGIQVCEGVYQEQFAIISFHTSDSLQYLLKWAQRVTNKLVKVFSICQQKIVAPRQLHLPEVELISQNQLVQDSLDHKCLVGFGVDEDLNWEDSKTVFISEKQIELAVIFETDEGPILLERFLILVLSLIKRSHRCSL